MWEGPVGKASGLSWTRGTWWVCTQRLASGMFWGKYGPRMASSFSSLLRSLLFFTKAVVLKPFVPAETLKACALIGLHLMAAESAFGSSAGQSPD